jgi:hypothetical protein
MSFLPIAVIVLLPFGQRAYDRRRVDYRGCFGGGSFHECN